MASTHAAGRVGSVVLRGALGGALAAFVVWEMSALLVVARSLSVDYLDSFEYLGNARVLAGSDVDLDYRWRRPPLVPLLQAALHPPGDDLAAALVAFGAAHALAWTLAACALAALWWLLSRELPPLLALLGTALVAANPMFLHLVPFALVDVAAMLATTLALGAYLVARRSGGRASAALCGVALAVAMATKYDLVLLVPCLVAFECAEALARRDARPLRAAFPARTVRIVAIGVACWLGLHVALRLDVGGAGLDAPFAIVGSLVEEIDYVGLHVAEDDGVAFPGWDDPYSEYVEELYQVTPLALVATFAVGVARAVRRGTPADRLHLVWLTLFLSVMSFVIVTKSSRYLLPVLPSLVHVALRGLADVARHLGRWLDGRVAAPSARAAIRVLAVAATLVAVLRLPVAQAYEQVRHFDDPIYRSGFLERLAREIDARVPVDAPLLWRGNLYSIYPEDPVFFPHDETFYFHHVGRPTLEFFLGRRVDVWPVGRPYRRESLVETFATSGAVVTHGDRFWLTHLADELPDVPLPLRLDLIERRSFVPTRRSPAVLEDARDRDRRIRLRVEGRRFALPAGVVGEGWHAFYRASAGAPLAPYDAPLATPPAAIELLRVNRIELAFRS